jgi:hypothetical protein
MVNGVKMKLIKTEDEQGVMYSLSGDNLPENYVLSKQNCDEIFAVVDVEKLARERLNATGWDADLPFIAGFKDGFNKAMELNKDKVFTLEDVKKAIKLSREKDEYKFDGKDCEYKFQDKEIIKSFIQPTEIEVEIVMRPASLVYKSNLVIEELDSEGCLILKRVI